MEYFVGWDVGGWNCDRNANSRDSLAVLMVDDNRLARCGVVYRGNIRPGINEEQSITNIVNRFCRTQIKQSDHITMAIDTPLGMPQALISLLTSQALPDQIPQSYAKNPYLYRETEMWLFRQGFSPLSAIKDMIGSQATKGMHLIAKFGLTSRDGRCGVWTNQWVTAIETYPAPSKKSETINQLYAALPNLALNHEDQIDAVYCALVAYLYGKQRNALVAPVDNPPMSEGWIWIPKDVVGT